MPNTKNFYLRVRILDGLLQSRKGVSIQECLRVINNRLAARDIPPVTSKDTILKDMTEIANEKHIIIESFPDTFDRRIIRYRYEQAGFSIFPTSLTDDDIKEIEGALELLSRFDGMPQMQWIRDLCSRFDVTLNSADMPVVEFEESDTVFGREFFTGLFHAIIDKRPNSSALSLLSEAVQTTMVPDSQKCPSSGFHISLCPRPHDLLPSFSDGRLCSY